MIEVGTDKTNAIIESKYEAHPIPQSSSMPQDCQESLKSSKATGRPSLIGQSLNKQKKLVTIVFPLAFVCSSVPLFCSVTLKRTDCRSMKSENPDAHFNPTALQVSKVHDISLLGLFPPI